MENKNAKSLNSQVVQIINLINYQSGSVVSREVVKKPNGSITAFAFDEGEGLSEDTAPYDAIIQGLEGST